MKTHIIKKSGFTLIELLVVIAIIAILATILLPSLNKAKALAKRVACMSGQKNMGLGFGMYQSEHNGVYPVRVSNGGCSGYTVCASNGVPVNYGQLVQMEYCEIGTLYCPADGHFDTDDYRDLEATSDNFADASKIVNSYFGLVGSYMYLWRSDLKQDKHYATGTYPLVPNTAADVFSYESFTSWSDQSARLSPSEVAILADVYVGDYGFYVHGDGYCITFGDGHANFFEDTLDPPTWKLHLSSAYCNWLWQMFDECN